MKKFSLKWKLFLIGCYLQLILSGIGLFFTIVAMFNDSGLRKDTGIVALFIGCFTIICVNSFLNIFALHRYFPDTPIPKTLRSYMIAAGILNCLVLLFFLLTGIIGSQTSAEEEIRRTVVIMLIGYFLILTIGIFTQVLQFQLFSFLNKKEKNKMKSLIDSLGSNEELYPDSNEINFDEPSRKKRW